MVSIWWGALPGKPHHVHAHVTITERALIRSQTAQNWNEIKTYGLSMHIFFLFWPQ